MASHGWFERFKLRHSLHSLKLKGELAFGDVDAAQEYPANFAEIINDNSYTPDQVFNADESGLFWKKCLKGLMSLNFIHRLVVIKQQKIAYQFFSVAMLQEIIL